jgi:hypothetical protein
MYKVDEITGDITLTQGDAGEYCLTGLPTDKPYVAWFAVQDEKRKPIGEEIRANVEDGSVSFAIKDTLTNLFKVKSSEETATYYAGVKICDADWYEDTVTVGNKEDGERIIITVYPKQVEGGPYINVEQ